MGRVAQDKICDPLRGFRSDALGDHAPDGKTNHMHGRNVQRIQQGNEIIRQSLNADQTIRQGGQTVPAHVITQGPHGLGQAVNDTIPDPEIRP